MPAEIFLVKVGMSMTEGVVEEWYVPDGGSVRKGELLYRLETEKVNLDVDAEYSGIVKHLVAEGVTMAPGDVIGYLYAEDEAIPERLPDVGSATAHQARPAPAVESAASAGPEGSTPSQLPGGRVRVSPVARRLAREGRIDLTTLTGSGPAGRIVEADVLAAHSARQESARPETDDSRRRSSPMARKLARELGVDMSLVAGTGPGGRITRQDVEQQQAAISTHGAEHATAQADIPVPLTSMRRTIARRMHDSLQSMAQLTMDMDVVMDDAIKLRAQLIDEWADDSIRPTYTDLVIRAAAKALEKHQLMNASFGTAEIILHGAINVGMAVALDDGLIVPVIRSANGLSMRALVQECARLAAAAREGNL
ncbi:MAG: 2-oxo acid dehydrogenase subunit E2, partial [Pseudomonadales bacterium]|nr:2-oxo acid dehydrogenase subunit E2 [Pseudomonadales bacterium]